MDYMPFGGLSSQELTYLIYKPFDAASPLVLKKDLKATDLNMEEMSMFKFIKQFLLDVKEGQPIKLTTKGNLNRKFVQQSYQHRIITSKYVDEGFSKILKEEDFYPTHFSHILTKIAGLCKKYKNKLSLTKKGEKVIENDILLYIELLKAFTTKFNWSYMTYYPDEVAQLGWGLSVFNFMRYGEQERKLEFYVDRYVHIFGDMLDAFNDNRHTSPYDQLKSCYQQRFFNRFCDLFGFASTRVEGENILTRQYFIKKTPLLDKVFFSKNNIGDFAMN